jgi:magnesium-dependent phosphatase 1
MTSKHSTETFLYSSLHVPKLIVFDLDFTIWHPEMYELSGGSPFRKNAACGGVFDSQGEQVHLFPHVKAIFEAFKGNPCFADTSIAVASSTSYPSWAGECMELFELDDDIPFRAIYPDNKQIHFAQLSGETDCDYSDMLFFDNAFYNIRDVRPLGVTCVHCPEGLTMEHWEQGLQTHSANKRK